MAASAYADLDPEFRPIYKKCKPASMTSPERMYALYKAVVYLEKAGIQGAFAECGVWRGGSVMVMAETLLRAGRTDREIYLYDTFEGMPEPSVEDVDHAGKPAASLLVRERKDEESLLWAYAPIDAVRRNLTDVAYPADRYRFVPGRVEDTIPATVPERIALLRLDTDWYQSTLHELTHLYPRLEPGGVLIIDDYGHWKGARRAVDEYFGPGGPAILLNRIDYTGRIGVKLN